MPPVPDTPSKVVTPDQVPSNAFRVLVTGFGPFLHYEENPSWLAVKPLQNVVMQTDPIPQEFIPAPTTTTANGSSGASTSTSASSISSSTTPTPPAPAVIPTEELLESCKPRPIHITALKIPVTYDAVLSIVPGLHARPPVLPEDAPADCAPPPASNYDFIFHIGVAGRGPLRMERQGHKLGYHMKDASGKLAPVVRASPKDFSRRDGAEAGPSSASTSTSQSGGPNGANPSTAVVSAAENMERERLGMDLVEGSNNDPIARPTRGFGAGYESSPDEITTDIDVTRLVHDLKSSGVDQIYTSMDAGHYLCDFIYYCSLAEVKRSSKPYEKRRNTQVLFLHCPPVDQPLSTQDVTNAIKKIVVWVCNEQQVLDVREDAAAGGAQVVPAAATGQAAGAHVGGGSGVGFGTGTTGTTPVQVSA